MIRICKMFDLKLWRNLNLILQTSNPFTECYDYKQIVAKTTYGPNGKCSKKTYECLKGRQMIVGGVQTLTGEFPHMAGNFVP